MMHQISLYLRNETCCFSPFYADGLLAVLRRLGWLDFTILGGRHRAETARYLHANALAFDEGRKQGPYDLVVTCTDLIVQRNIRKGPLVLVQEGITEQEGALFDWVKRFSLPRFLANTAATGLSNAYDVFCVASPGYRDHFIRNGVSAEKIAVTGIPNFDHVDGLREQSFPLKGFVLAATSPLRESLRLDDRAAFIRKAVQLAAGRPLVFKLHPNAVSYTHLRAHET